MAESAPISGSENKLPFSFHGQGGTLFGIHIRNLFLTVLTLGIYSFWAKVKLRKYLWGQFEVAGDRFAYHGSAMEILKGWLKAMAVFIIPYIVLSGLPDWLGLGTAVKLACVLGAFALLMFFIPFAIVGTRRYRLSRTSWRNIRFSFKGSVKECFVVYALGFLCVALTLGFYGPYFEMKLKEFMVGKSRLGNRNFKFDGKGGDLIGSFALALVLAIPTLLISLLWYRVKVMRYSWDHTSLGDARFSSTFSLGGMLKLSLGNVLLVLFTLGFGYSWAEARYFRFLADNLSLEKTAELDSISQEAVDSTATAEELGSFLELDFDLG
jgi:uncharacterized membrane protein YjgN (DUF898 family)